MWPIEDIPDKDKIFYRVHDGFFNRKGKLSPSVFQERGDGDQKGMSTDWERYANAKLTQSNTKKNPEKNSIVSFIAGSLRSIAPLTVVHAPIFNEEEKNRAHSNVKGVDSENVLEIRLKLLDMLSWEIHSEATKGFF